MVADFFSTYLSRLLLLLSVFSIGAYTVAFPGTASWTLFFFIVLAIIGTYLSTLYLIKGVTASFVHHFDDTHTLVLTMKTLPFSILLLPALNAHVNFAGTETNATIASIGKRTVEWHIPLGHLPRDVHKKVTVIFSGTDVFGLFRSVKRRTIAVDVPIYPRVLPKNITLSLLNQIHQVIRPFQVAREVPHEIKQIRPFHERDSVHSIDWKSSARINTLMVKEYEPPLQWELVLVFLGAADEFFEETLRTCFTLHYELAKKYPLSFYLGGDFNATPSYQSNRYSYVTVQPSKEIPILLAKRPVSRSRTTFTIVFGPKDLESSFSSSITTPYVYLHAPRIVREEGKHETYS